jgi:ribonucleoside-diphosphate reductase beta chain
MPGLYKMIKLIARDESRHISFGAYVTALMISMYGESLFEEFNKYFESLAQEIAFPLINEIRKILLSNSWREEDKGPLFNYLILSDEGFKDIMDFAMNMFQRRYSVIHRAVKMKPEHVRRLHLREMNIVEE